ncbi:hypothetical protein B0O80DRAFT_440523 [Mortierella sp. GBAus27b]|nr:hypothetical protein BGX31_003632 [Mortierella sp. GBA43]KAI8359551.1 hypothetical protein B0O80DRAFT_440523 [Mortierella sp. GBAus27b]
MVYRISSLITLCILGSLSISYAFQPTTTWGSTSSFADNRALYISGGSTAVQGDSTTTQTFMIDLSVSWSVGAPVYKQLPDGPASFSATGALSPDAKEWLVMLNDTGYIYNVDGSSWSSPLTNSNFTRNRLSAATDPDTGIVYIPNGIRDASGKNRLLAIDVAKRTINTIPMFQNLSTSAISASWSQAIGSLVITGGPTNGLYTYNPTKGWSDLSKTVKGNIPTSRVGSCFAPVSGGAKLVYFGGNDQTGKATLNDIYMLDVGSMTWKRGPSVEVVNGRTASSCGVSNGFFIAWGGLQTINGTSSFPADTTIVYDMTNEKWTSTYFASSRPSSEQSDDEGSQGSTVRTILIVVLGLFVVFVGIGAFVLCRRPSRADAMLAQAVSLDKDPIPASQQDSQRSPSMDILPAYAPGSPRAMTPYSGMKGSPAFEGKQLSRTMSHGRPGTPEVVPSSSLTPVQGPGLGHNIVVVSPDIVEDEDPLQSYHLPGVQYQSVTATRVNQNQPMPFP